MTELASVSAAGAAKVRASVVGWRAYLAALRQDSSAFLFIAAFSLAVASFALALGRPGAFAPLIYAHNLTWAVLFLIALRVVMIGRSAMGDVSPLRRFMLDLAPDPEQARDIVLFTGLLFFYGVFTSLKSLTPNVIPFYADRPLAAIDAALHGVDPWRLLQPLMTASIVRFVELAYQGGWGVLMVLTMAAAVFMRRLRPIRTQYVWTFLLMWVLLGSVLAAAFMSAGPCYYEAVTGDPRFRPLVDLIQAVSTSPEGAAKLQAFLWRANRDAAVAMGSGISAFPSMHLANAALILLVARRLHPWLLAPALAFLALIMAGSVLLGWHYAIDGYVAVAATVLLWNAVGAAIRRSVRST